MTSMWHPIMYVKYKVFLSSAGVPLDSKNMDKDYVERLVNLIKGIRPYGALVQLGSAYTTVFLGAITSCWPWTAGMILTESMSIVRLILAESTFRARPDLTGLHVPNTYMMDVVVRSLKSLEYPHLA